MNELQIIKEYFPKSANKIIKSFQNTISEYNQYKTVDAEKDIELQNYIIENTRNLNINVKLVKDSDPNAFTIYSDIDIDFNPKIGHILDSLPLISSIYELYAIHFKLLKANIDAYVDSDNKIIFTHNLSQNFILTTYQTTGLKKLLKNDVEARFAILLHEIGHWHNYNQYIIIDLLKIIGWIGKFWSLSIFSKYPYIIVILFVIEFMLINYINSINETNCDKFAKELGYGDHASRAFLKLLYPNLNVNNKTKELKQISSTFTFKFKDFFTRLLDGYPHEDTRIISNINEGILNLTFEIELKNLLFDFDNFFNKI